MSAKKNKDIVRQPDEEVQKEQVDIIENTPDVVSVRGKDWKVYWMHPIAKLKITKIILSDNGDDQTINCKCAAVIMLRRNPMIFFFYWIVWRWFYYVKEYRDEELLPVINAAKKKVQLEEYLACTILLTEMKTTIMAMTRKEANHILQEQIMAQHGQSQKSTNTSANP